MPIIPNSTRLPPLIYFPHEFMRGAILRALKANYGDDTAGWWLGLSHDGIARFAIGDADHFVRWDGAALNVKGHVEADSGDLGDLTMEGVLTIGSDGGFYQGSGDFATPDTGLKLWNESGIGRLAGFAEGVLQAGFDTGGAITWAEGKGRLDAGGLAFSPDANASVTLGDHEAKTPLLISLDYTGEGPWVYLLSLEANVDQSQLAGLVVDLTGAAGSVLFGVTSGLAGYHGAALKGGVLPLGPSTDLWSLQLSGAPVDGGNQRYTSLADATADTDALNRRTADNRYIRSGDSITVGGAGSSIGVFGATPVTRQTIAAFVDNSAGAVDGELAAIPDLHEPTVLADLYTELAANTIPTIRDNFAELAVAVAEIRAALAAYGWLLVSPTEARASRANMPPAGATK